MPLCGKDIRSLCHGRPDGLRVSGNFGVLASTAAKRVSSALAYSAWRGQDGSILRPSYDQRQHVEQTSNGM